MADYGDLTSLMAGSRRSSPYDRKRRLAEQMLQSGADFSPIQHPLQGAARLAQALIGGYMANKADTEEKADETKRNETLGAELAKLDPKGSLTGIAKLDPSLALKIAGQGLIEKQKLETQQGTRAAAADGLGASYGVPPQGGQIQQGPLPPPGGYQGALGGYESGNNPMAVNPQSGAGGQFQFIPPTWAELRAKHPDLQLPGSPTQATLPQQAAAEARFRDSNAQAFQAVGIPPTPANLYLAHRTGVQGTQTLLKADPNAPMAAVVPPSWIAQNPDMQGKTVGQFLQLAQQRFPGQAPAGQQVTVQANPQGNAQQPGAPLTINMQGPGGVPQGSADGVPQGSADGGMQGAPPPPQAPGGMPAVTAQPPAIPDVPRPQPTPQQIRRAQDQILAGVPRAQAEAAMNAEVDRDWSVARERAKMEYDRQFGEYKSGRERADKAPQQSFDNANKLRGDFNGLQPVKDYDKANAVFKSAVEASKGDTKASDINMVYAFATMMDPGSVVRDSETGMVYATQGASDRIKGLVAGLQGKSGLGVETKAALLKEMGSRYDSYRSAYDNIVTTFGGIAERNNVNKDDVIRPIAPVEWKNLNAGPPQIKSDDDYNALPSGSTFVGPDGKTRRKP